MSQQNKYRACIVGLSGIGAGKPPSDGENGLGGIMPYSHAPGYAYLPNTEVVGVCDLKEELLESVVSDWSGVFPALKGFSDYHEMMETCKPDILSVVTSDNRHADIVVHAAESGVKGIFCEKPIATSLADADRMIEAVERCRVPMSFNHTRRWIPIYRQVKTMVAEGAIGTLRQITINLGGPRAILFRNGTHLIDMGVFMADSNPSWVFADSDEGFEDYWPYQGDGGRNPDLEPGCTGHIHFENGIRAYYRGIKGAASPNGTELIGTEGWIYVHDAGARICVHDAVKEIKPDPVTHSYSAAAIRDLIHVIENGGSTISPPREARKTLEIILGFLASQKHGNIRVDLPLDESTV